MNEPTDGAITPKCHHESQCSSLPGVACEDSFLTDTPVGIADATSVQSELRSALSSTLEVYTKCG